MDRVYANAGEERFKSCDLAKTFQRLSHLGPTQQNVLFQKSWENHLFYCQDFINVLKLNFFTFLDFILQQREFLEQLISQIKIDDMCINRLQDFGRKPFYQIRMKIYFNSFAQVLFLKWKKWRILFFLYLGFPSFPDKTKFLKIFFY